MYSAFNEVLRYILHRRDKGKNCGIKTKKDVWRRLEIFISIHMSVLNYMLFSLDRNKRHAL